MIEKAIGPGIIAAAIIIATGLYIYFTPFQTCLRKTGVYTCMSKVQ